MFQSTKVGRAVAVLSITVLAAAGIASPVGAQVSASIVDNGDGTATITYSGVTNPPALLVKLLPSGETCPASPPFAALTLSTAGGGLGASPATITAGMTVDDPMSGPTPLPAGSYQACLYQSAMTNVLLEGLAINIGAPEPTTTTTTTTSTTTTTTTTPPTPPRPQPDSVPAKPRFTG